MFIADWAVCGKCYARHVHSLRRIGDEFTSAEDRLWLAKQDYEVSLYSHMVKITDKVEREISRKRFQKWLTIQEESLKQQAQS